MSNLDFFVNVKTTSAPEVESTNYIKTMGVYAKAKQGTPPPSPTKGTKPVLLAPLTEKGIVESIRPASLADDQEPIVLVTSATDLDNLLEDDASTKSKLAFNYLNKIYVVIKDRIPEKQESIVFEKLNTLIFLITDYVGENIAGYGFKGDIYKPISLENGKDPEYEKLPNTCYCVDINLEIALPAKWCSYPGYSNMTYETFPEVQWVDKSKGDAEILRENGITFMWKDGGNNPILGYWWCGNMLGSEHPKLEYARVSIQNAVFEYTGVNKPDYDMTAFIGIQECIRKTLTNLQANGIIKDIGQIILPPPSQQQTEDVVRGYVKGLTSSYNPSGAIWYYEMMMNGSII